MEISLLFFQRGLFSNLLLWHGSRGIVYLATSFLLFVFIFSFFRVHAILPLYRFSGVFLVFTRWNTEACGGSDPTGHSENFRNRALLSSFLLARSFLSGRMGIGTIVPFPFIVLTEICSGRYQTTSWDGKYRVWFRQEGRGGGKEWEGRWRVGVRCLTVVLLSRVNVITYLK